MLEQPVTTRMSAHRSHQRAVDRTPAVIIQLAVLSHSWFVHFYRIDMSGGPPFGFMASPGSQSWWEHKLAEEPDARRVRYVVIRQS